MSRWSEFLLVLPALALYACVPDVHRDPEVRASSDGGIHAHGVVRDPAGRPIPQARIQITGPEIVFEATADQRGCFDLGRVVAPGSRRYDFTAVASGFKLATTKVSTGEDNLLAVTLQPETSTSESAVNYLSENPCAASRR